MGVYKIFPSQDTTIYTDYNTLNAGLDAILDLSKNNSILYPSSSTSRILIQFDDTDLSNVYSKITGSYTASLKMYNAHVQGIPTNFNIIANPLWESWDMGTGRFANEPETDNGASWAYRSANQINAWNVGGAPGSKYYAGNVGGGTWYTNYAISQSFNYFSTKDINLNVTSVVNAWSSSAIPNYGFIIRNSGSIEFDKNYTYTFNFFSRDTNTIYPPCLEFKWDDSTITTSSAAVTIPNEEINIAVANNKTTFYDNEYVKFRIYAREKYPARVYSTTALTKYNKILPTGDTYYSIIDASSNLVVIDFDNVATKLSADNTSSYFMLYMNGLEPERYYYIQIKTTINGGTYIFDDDYYFRVAQTVK
jgi:hypothetical protein